MQKLAEKRDGKNPEKSRKILVNEYLPPSFFRNGAFLRKENKGANSGENVACKQPDQVGVPAAKPR